jgi:hypothetical protein
MIGSIIAQGGIMYTSNSGACVLSNEVVRQFLDTFELMNAGQCDAFRHVQSVLLAPDVLVILTDPRGTVAYRGIDECVLAMLDWTQHFNAQQGFRREYFEETSTQVFVKFQGDVTFIHPVHGDTVSRAREHHWSHFFKMERGHITKIEIRLLLHLEQKTRGGDSEGG